MEFIRVVERGESVLCEVVHGFNDLRSIVLYEGVYVFADRLCGNEWELSGIPARDGAEKQTLNTLVKALEAKGATVVVSKV